MVLVNDIKKVVMGVSGCKWMTLGAGNFKGTVGEGSKRAEQSLAGTQFQSFQFSGPGCL